MALGGLFFLLLLVIFVWFLSNSPNELYTKLIINFLIAVVLTILFFGLLGIFLLGLSLFSKKSLGGRINEILIKSLYSVYPLAFVPAKLLNIDKD